MPSKDDIIDKLHSEACQLGLAFYIDPISGYQVQTRIAHLKRGSCCHSGCRHCPYPEGDSKKAKLSEESESE